MPYSKLADARIKELDGVPLTLSQVNAIAAMADAIGSDSNKNGWAIAISNFKKTHSKSGGSWVESKKTEKDFSDVVVEKQENGRYKIIAISTVAIKDLENETFTTDAMDYEVKEVKQTGDYPEFRVFHKKYLGIGKVTKMSRVGIFAVDEGESYDDPFSLSVCEKMLSNNKDGKWKVSRGFVVLEASGACSDCGSILKVRTKHMAVGFQCPTCKSVHLNYKGTLDGLRFLKTKTFDITVTDVPAVPWTGVQAFPFSTRLEQEVTMNKKQLKEKLIEAGLEEKEIDARLDDLTPEALKEFDGIPVAEVLKEFSKKSDKEEDTDGDFFTLDPSVLKEFTNIVHEEVEKSLDGMEIDIEDSEEFKEYSETLNTVVEQQKEILTMLKELQSVVVTKEKEDDEETPRKFRILRSKSKDKKTDPNADEGATEDPNADPAVDENGDPIEPGSKEAAKKKKMPPWLQKSLEEDVDADGAVIQGADGTHFKSMSEFALGGEK
jgi:hypothetical protein